MILFSSLKRFQLDPAKVPLRLLLVVPFVLQTVGAVALVGFFAYRNGQEAVDNLANQLMNQVSERVSDRLDTYLQAPQQVVMANQLSFQREKRTIADMQRQRLDFWQQINSVPFLASSYIATEQGKQYGYERIQSQEMVDYIKKMTGETLAIGTLYFSEVDPAKFSQRRYYLVDAWGNPTKLSYTDSTDFQATSWYRQLKANPKQSWSPISTNLEAPMLGISALAPILDENREFQGAFVSYIKLTELSTFLSQLDFAQTGQVFILERSGDLVATSTLESLGRQQGRSLLRLPAVNSQNAQTQAIAQQLKAHYGDLATLQTPQHLSLVANHQQQYLRIVPYQDAYGLDWLIVTVVPQAQFMAQIQAQNLWTGLFCLGTLLGATALGLLAARRITRPLQRLNRAAHNIAHKEFESSFVVGGLGEVRQLSLSLQQMAVQLKAAFQLRTHYQQKLEEQVRYRTIELQRSRDLREAIFNESTDAIFLVELPPTARILDCNQRSVDLFEATSKADLIGIQQTELHKTPCPPEDLASMAAELNRNGFWQSEAEYLTQTGKSFWGRLTAKPIQLAGQTIQLVQLTDISQAKQAEATRKKIEFELQQNQARLENLTTNLPGAVYSLAQHSDGSFVFEYISSGCRDVLEVEPEAFLNDAELSFEMIHPDDRAGYSAAVARSAQTLEPFTYEWRLITPSGRLKWVQATSRPEPRGDGAIIWHGVSLDITERKQQEADRKQAESQRQQTELLLKQSEDRFRLVFEKASMGIVLCSPPDFKLTLCNQFFQEFVGYSASELATLNWEDLTYPEDWATEIILARECLAGRRDNYQIEKRYVHKNGTIRWGNLIVSCIRDQAGDIQFGFGMVKDVTDRKQAENSLRESEERFRRAFEDAAIGMALVALDGKITQVNRALSDMLGYSEVSLVRLSWQDLTHPADLEENLTYVRQVLAGECNSFHLEKRYIHQQGQIIWVLLSVSVIRNPQGAPLYFVSQVQDISDRHKVDRIKDEFISVVSHELRTPLTAIRGALGILETGIYEQRPEKAKHMLQIALNNSDRLMRLVNDILDLERLESGKSQLVMTTCQVADLMQQAMDAVQLMALQSGVQLQMLPLTGELWADPDAIVQTLTNLLSNAIKFSPSRGIVELRAEALPNSHILFAVADQGRGIPANQLEKIFDRFQQVDISDSRQKGGTGLGLAICESIVQQHNGKIWAESILTQGSTFYFVVPMLPNSV